MSDSCECETNEAETITANLRAKLGLDDGDVEDADSGRQSMLSQFRATVAGFDDGFTSLANAKLNDVCLLIPGFPLTAANDAQHRQCVQVLSPPPMGDGAWIQRPVTSRKRYLAQYLQSVCGQPNALQFADLTLAALFALEQFSKATGVCRPLDVAVGHLTETIRSETGFNLTDDRLEQSLSAELLADDTLGPTVTQIAFLVHWFTTTKVHHPDKKWRFRSAAAKLSPDRWSVRFDGTPDLFSVVSTELPVRSGLGYFELYPLTTDGPLRVGWATREAQLTAEHGLGQDRDCHSIGFDPIGRVVCHGGRWIQCFATSGDPLLWSDVVGCLVDFDRGRFVFTVNGEVVVDFGVMSLAAEVHFDRKSIYYPGASLAQHQHVVFNFGQWSFRYPPLELSNLNNGNNNPTTTTRKQFGRLSVTEKLEDGSYFFRTESFASDRVEPIFADQKQQECDRAVGAVLDGTAPIETLLDHSSVNLYGFMQSFVTYTRTESDAAAQSFQSLAQLSQTGIEIWERLAANNHNRFYGRMNELIDLYTNNQLDFVDDCEVSLEQQNLNQLLLLSILVLNPATHASLATELTTDRLLSICALRSPRVRSVPTTWAAQLAALWTLERASRHLLPTAPVVLDHLLATDLEMETRAFRERPLILEEFYGSNVNCERNAEHYQLAFCRWWLFSQVVLKHGYDRLRSSSKNGWNPEDRSGQAAKISADLYFVRSDLSWQCVRSRVATTTEQNAVYYFEVTLLTAGQMRIGWATAATALNKLKYKFGKFAEQPPVPIGADEFSVAFDGHHRCLWHENRRIELENCPQQWSVGDTVGCLVDGAKEQFEFYLNGVLLVPSSVSEHTGKDSTDSELFYLPTEGYHAAVALHWHQQCVANFGRWPFRFAPKRRPLADFSVIPVAVDNSTEALPSAQSSRNNPIILKNLNNVSVLVNSTATVSGSVQFATTNQQIYQSFGPSSSNLGRQTGSESKELPEDCR